MFADLVADVFPSQAHRAHDALGRQLEGQIANTAASGAGAATGGIGLASGVGAVQVANAREGRADGLAPPRCGWRVAAGIHERARDLA